MQFVRPQPFPEAVQKLGSRSPIGAALNGSQWRDVPVGLRERAFFSSEIENVRFLQRAQDALTDFLTGARETLPNGQTVLKTGSRSDFVEQLRKFAIAEGMGEITPGDKGTLKDITSAKRLGLIFDTNLRAANAYGHWKQGQDPDVLFFYPAQRFRREATVRLKRPLHWQNEDEVRLKSDLDFWLAMNSRLLGGFDVPWGPWGFGSGMGVRDVDRDEAESLGLIKKGEIPRPVEGDFNDKLKASTQNLAPELQAFLKERLGDAIEIIDGEARWTGRAASGRPARTPIPAPAPQPVGTAAPQPNLPPRERTARALAQALERAGIKDKSRVTAQDMTALRRELQKTDPAPASEIIRRVAIHSRRARFGETEIRAWTDEFLGYLPPDLARSLPRLTIGVRSLGGARGNHAPGGIVNLVPDLDPEAARRTLFHELTHWVHIDGPKWYRDLVREHFEARTAGEATAQLSGYSRNVRGKRDKWVEAYAGRIYSWERQPEGLEVPTRYMELLTETDAMLAEHWRDDRIRETLMVVLRTLF